MTSRQGHYQNPGLLKWNLYTLVSKFIAADDPQRDDAAADYCAGPKNLVNPLRVCSDRSLKILQFILHFITCLGCGFVILESKSNLGARRYLGRSTLYAPLRVTHQPCRP